jgi:hypothetical protein
VKYGSVFACDGVAFFNGFQLILVLNRAMNVIEMTTPKQTQLTQPQIVKVAIEAAETAVSAHGENLSGLKMSAEQQLPIFPLSLFASALVFLQI